jgi:hypothetical protein
LPFLSIDLKTPALASPPLKLIPLVQLAESQTIYDVAAMDLTPGTSPLPPSATAYAELQLQLSDARAALAAEQAAHKITKETVLIRERDLASAIDAKIDAIIHLAQYKSSTDAGSLRHVEILDEEVKKMRKDNADLRTSNEGLVKAEQEASAKEKKLSAYNEQNKHVVKSMSQRLQVAENAIGVAAPTATKRDADE